MLYQSRHVGKHEILSDLCIEYYLFFSEGYLFNSPQKAIAYILCIGNYIKH